MESVQVIGLLQETDPTSELVEDVSRSECMEDADADEDEDEQSEDDEEEDDDNEEEDGESIDEAPTQGAIIKPGQRETFDMDERDDDSYYTVSSGESADHNAGEADNSAAARPPPEATSARLSLPLTLTHPSAVSSRVVDKMEGSFICLLAFKLYCSRKIVFTKTSSYTIQFV